MKSSITMWIIYVALAAAWSGSALAFPQNDASDDRSGSFEADGFVFDGPASKPLTRSTSFTTPETTVVSSTTRRRATTTTTPAPDLQRDACVRSCLVTPEYNPVCGSDDVVYDNPGMLNCAAMCGKAVTLSYYGICQTTNMRG